MDIRYDDIVYDPAAGTGGFLIASFNRVKRLADPTRARQFAERNIYGAETSSHVAALAFVNMLFRGDGKHNLSFRSCFSCTLERVGTSNRLKFVEKATKPAKSKPRQVTKVLMNPLFALKDSKEKETHFIDHSLGQLVGNGLMFVILPASVFYERKHAAWRVRLLETNTLVASVSLPLDVFYPIATHSIFAIIRKGVAHPANEPVLWARIDDDGFVKRKNFRVERQGIDYKVALAKIAESLREWSTAGNKRHSAPGLIEFSPINPTMAKELVPQAHLGTPSLDLVQHRDNIFYLTKGMLEQRWDQQYRTETEAI